MNNTAII